jgi:secondary thiamine-phosphate synthase enzyme
MNSFQVRTSRHADFVEITGQVQQLVTQSNVHNGVVTIFVPHTTAGVTINENADPDVVADMLDALDRMVPWKSPAYRHAEGNTAAHVKSSMMGHTTQVILRDGKLQLGVWQGIYLCEFDGPRTRNVWISIVSG